MSNPLLSHRAPRIVAVLALLVGAGARAQDFRPAGIGGAETDDGAKAGVEIVVPQKTVHPGETLDVAVKMTMKPGWHIYWKNPGDSGQAPRFNWTTPGGGASAMMRGSSWTASDPQFPVPVRWQDAAGIVGYGYTGTVLFPATITVPGSTTPGQNAELSVSVSYLVCKDVCIPATATASVTFEVGMDPGDGGDKAAKKEIDQAKERLPVEPASLKVINRDDGSRRLELGLPDDGKAVKNVDFFPNVPAGVVIEDVKTEVRDGRVSVTFTPRRLAGMQVASTMMEMVIGYDVPDGSRRGVSVSIPPPTK